MFEESLVVQSAVSAFNNAALLSPAFFLYGLLMLPLFFVVYKYGNKFLEMIGWETETLQLRIIKWVIVMSLVWLVLFGGNYTVLRDAETLLPFMTGLVAFLGMMFIGYITRSMKLPNWKTLSGKDKRKLVCFCALVLLIIGLTDTHNWWGPILQITAFVGGAWFGRRMKYELRFIPFVSVFMFLFTIMILMQPEFFRFGQLGNLTLLHLIGVVAIGISIVDMLVLRNTKPREKIYQSAFVKLKWMMRCLLALMGCLFVMTESVPIFLGVCIFAGGLCWLKIVHSRNVPEFLADRLLMIAIFAFGLLTVMPVISCLAILGWLNIPHGNFVKESKILL